MRVAAGHGKSQLDDGGFAVFVMQRELELGYASLLHTQESCEFHDQPLCRKQQRLGFVHWCGQHQTRAIAGWRQIGFARIGQPVQSAIQFVYQCLTETARKSVTGQGEAFADRMHAHHREHLSGLFGLIQQYQRQSGEHGLEPGDVGHSGVHAGTGQQLCARRRGRGGDGRGVAQIG